MSKKKNSRGKKFNPNKKLQAEARKKLKNLCVAMVIDGRSDHCEVFNYKTAQKVPASQQLVELIAGLPWKWYIECSVVCRDQSGKEYVVSEPVYCASAYRQSDPRLSDFLNSNHLTFYKKQNPLHVITLAWVATPNIGKEVELPIETLDAIYTELGAFEYLSQWETDKLEDAA